MSEEYAPAEDWQMAPRPMVRRQDRVIGYLVEKPTGERKVVTPEWDAAEQARTDAEGQPLDGPVGPRRTDSRLVNHGAPVAVVTRAEHVGPDGHDQLKLGEQCECGTLGLLEHSAPTEPFDAVNAVERAADVIRSVYGPYERDDGVDASDDVAARLADAGLLVTDADRAVLDAARRLWKDEFRHVRPGVLTKCDCDLCIACARREAQT